MNWIRQAWKAPVFSPTGFVVRALVLVAFFLVCHQLGWREYTTIISGTSPTGDPLDTTMTLIGCTYFVSWSLLILVVPILLIAAGLMRLFLGTPAVPSPTAEVSPPGGAPQGS